MAIGQGFDNLIYGAMAMPRNLPSNPMAQMQRLRILRTMVGMGNMHIGPNQPRTSGMGYTPENPLASDPGMFQSPEFQQQANHYLGQYGLSLPTNTGQNAMLPNSGFFGAHPQLSGALEGAAYGLANADTSGGTMIEQIQGGLRGAMQGHAMRNQALMNPYMAPFAMAQQMEQLRDLSDQHQLRGAQTRLAMANADYAEQKPELAQQKMSEDLQKAQIRQLEFNSKQQERENRIPSSRVPYFNQLGIDPENATPKDWARVNKAYAADQGAMAYGRASAGINAGLDAGTKETKEDELNRKRSERVDSFIEHEKTSWWAINAKDLPVDASPADKRAWLQKNFQSLSPDQQQRVVGESPAPKANKNSPTPKTQASGGGTMSFGDLAKQAAVTNAGKAIASNPPRFAGQSPMPNSSPSTPDPNAPGMLENLWHSLTGGAQ